MRGQYMYHMLYSLRERERERERELPNMYMYTLHASILILSAIKFLCTILCQIHLVDIRRSTR